MLFLSHAKKKKHKTLIYTTSFLIFPYICHPSFPFISLPPISLQLAISANQCSYKRWYLNFFFQSSMNWAITSLWLWSVDWIVKNVCNEVQRIKSSSLSMWLDFSLFNEFCGFYWLKYDFFLFNVLQRKNWIEKRLNWKRFKIWLFGNIENDKYYA